MSKEVNCHGCAYSLLDESNPQGIVGAPKILVCRRYPPALLLLGQGPHAQIHSRYPNVTAGNWCGEYLDARRIEAGEVKELGQA